MSVIPMEDRQSQPVVASPDLPGLPRHRADISETRAASLSRPPTTPLRPGSNAARKRCIPSDLARSRSTPSHHANMAAIFRDATAQLDSPEHPCPARLSEPLNTSYTSNTTRLRTPILSSRATRPASVATASLASTTASSPSPSPAGVPLPTSSPDEMPWETQETTLELPARHLSKAKDKEPGLEPPSSGFTSPDRCLLATPRKAHVNSWLERLPDSRSRYPNKSVDSTPFKTFIGNPTAARLSSGNGLSTASSTSSSGGVPIPIRTPSTLERNSRRVSPLRWSPKHHLTSESSLGILDQKPKGRVSSNKENVAPSTIPGPWSSLTSSDPTVPLYRTPQRPSAARPVPWKSALPPCFNKAAIRFRHPASSSPTTRLVPKRKRRNASPDSNVPDSALQSKESGHSQFVICEDEADGVVVPLSPNVEQVRKGKGKGERRLRRQSYFDGDILPHLSPSPRGKRSEGLDLSRPGMGQRLMLGDVGISKYSSTTGLVQGRILKNVETDLGS